MRTTFVKGALVGAITASVVMVSAAAWAGTGVGGVFNLGKTNSVNSQSLLIGKNSSKELQITNTGSGPALGLSVAAGKAPLTVNSSAGKATNLNADKLDGLDSTAFQSKSHRILSNIISPQSDQPAGTIGPWTFTLSCGVGGPATMTVTGPGTIGGTTSLAIGGGTAGTYVNALGPIGSGAQSGVGQGAQMSQDLFLQNGTTAVEVHTLMTASNGGLFENCSLIGDATQI
jgi:hypothetical protein